MTKTNFSNLGVTVPVEGDYAPGGPDVPRAFEEFSESFGKGQGKGKLLIAQDTGAAAFKAMSGDATLAEDGTLTVVNHGLLPVGVILPAALAVAPAGFLLCDGSAVARAAFAALFSAIGTTYGAGNGSTTFNVPNLVERVPVGKGSSLLLGASGGEATHKLTEAEMPSHSHSATAYEGHVVGNTLAGFYYAMQNPVGPAAVSAAGGSAPHNNMQPYQVVSYLIKT